MTDWDWGLWVGLGCGCGGCGGSWRHEGTLWATGVGGGEVLSGTVLVMDDGKYEEHVCMGEGVGSRNLEIFNYFFLVLYFLTYPEIYSEILLIGINILVTD